MYGHADLAGEQDVLARLRHRAVGRRDHEDRAVHLRRAGDHVLDVVGVARDSRRARSARLAVSYSTCDGGDRDAALLLLRSVVDLREALEPRRPSSRPAPSVMAAVSVVLPWSM